METLAYMYVAYTVIWAGLFVYLLKLHLDARRIETELRTLREALDARGK
jgi:CcmD family protein